MYTCSTKTTSVQTTKLTNDVHKSIIENDTAVNVYVSVYFKLGPLK